MGFKNRGNEARSAAKAVTKASEATADAAKAKVAEAEKPATGLRQLLLPVMMCILIVRWYQRWNAATSE